MLHIFLLKQSKLKTLLLQSDPTFHYVFNVSLNSVKMEKHSLSSRENLTGVNKTHELVKTNPAIFIGQYDCAT